MYDDDDDLKEDWDTGDDLDEPFEEEDDDDETTTCPYCGARMHEESVRCPACENYISREDSPRQRRPWWIVITVVVCLVIVALWVRYR